MEWVFNVFKLIFKFIIWFGNYFKVVEVCFGKVFIKLIVLWKIRGNIVECGVYICCLFVVGSCNIGYWKDIFLRSMSSWLICWWVW